MKLKKGASFDKNIFEQLVDGFPDIIHSVDEKGKIFTTNQKACDLLGYTKEELLGLSIWDIYPDSIQEKVKKGFQFLQERGEIKAVESILKRKDGELIDVEIRSFALYDKEGSFLRTFSIIRDISKLKQMESQLEQGSKLAALGQLLAGISHDIRNPVAAIEMRTNLMEKMFREGKLNEKMIIKSLAGLRKGTNALIHLADHLVAFSSREEDEHDSCFINSILTDAEMILDHKIIKSKVKLEKNYSADPTADFQVEGYRRLLEQVFVNLMANACNAMATCEKSLPRTLTIHLRSEKEQVVVELSDTGPGIEGEILQKMAEPQKNIRSRKMLGLGLSMVQSVINKHSGALELKNNEGAGAFVKVTLPRVVPEIE